jgi:hypothetical protein
MGTVATLFNSARNENAMSENLPIKRATVRPKHLDLPYPLPASPPVPEPKAAAVVEQEADLEDKDRAPRTRYGDWEREGIAWDF